ncbi:MULTISPECIES: TIM-barrel domain-containing protein [Subtercola]|uniref:Glycoside hydrolase family 31 protein n=1 Tax=Subtercola vilae TaxID=2056433 RepID=A0A4T2C7F4_9MICO|nr:MULTISPECIES: TIM-barrel domain-containing protein [Subtercola]MEA9986789.1 glycoside hydrolase family 31 protein [Subtercola sp. RTI3]TIH40147.1 glycoside hydrolase family 31 protein [Subtercola vilae]
MVSYLPSPTSLEVRHGHEVLRIEAWGTDSARVRAALYRLPSSSVGALDVEAPPTVNGSVVVETTSRGARLVNGELTVTVTFDEAEPYPEPQLTFTRTSTGAELLAESREHFWQPGARVFLGNGSGAYEIHQQFAAYPGEKLFGMGQRTHGRLNIKGLSLDLVQRNAEVNIPFVLSDRGYGLLWNMPAVGRVEFAENVTRWQVNQAREIDYWITAAPTPAAILGRYADATGHTPELPEWASGFWQSKLRYRTQDELLTVAREHTRLGLPLSVIVADFFHWSAMGDYRFDETEWPDVPAMVAELASLGVHLMVSIWPTISPLSENFADYRDRGLLVGTDQGVEFLQSIQDKGMATPMPVGFYDPSNPETREYVWGLVSQNYLDAGIRVFWLDASEPELNPAHPANMHLYAGPGAEVANIYPRDNARLFAEGMAAAGQQPTVLLCRSAWAGSQKYGAAVWSGDIPATWGSLDEQVRAGLNIAISGIPWWTTDIGGFHGGNASDPAYQELVTRWFQYGVFCPLFRLHGDREPRTPTGYAMTGGPNEVWSFGDETFALLREVLELRERLRPYIHDQMRLAAATGLPPMRPLFVDYPDDPGAWMIDDQFLFGPDILVCPVTAPGITERSVYLPGTPGSGRWIDAYTGASLAPGQSITAEAPLSHIPIYLREEAQVSLAT